MPFYYIPTFFPIIFTIFTSEKNEKIQLLQLSKQSDEWIESATVTVACSAPPLLSMRSYVRLTPIQNNNNWIDQRRRRTERTRKSKQKCWVPPQCAYLCHVSLFLPAPRRGSARRTFIIIFNFMLSILLSVSLLFLLRHFCFFFFVSFLFCFLFVCIFHMLCHGSSVNEVNSGSVDGGGGGGIGLILLVSF